MWLDLRCPGYCIGGITPFSQRMWELLAHLSPAWLRLALSEADSSSRWLLGPSVPCYRVCQAQLSLDFQAMQAVGKKYQGSVCAIIETRCRKRHKYIMPFELALLWERHLSNTDFKTYKASTSCSSTEQLLNLILRGQEFCSLLACFLSCLSYFLVGLKSPSIRRS